MTLRQRAQLRSPVAYRNWVIPGRAPIIRSDAYYSFCDSLRRYVQEDIPGRSVLIAGHRGSGKTTLVREAVAEVAELQLAQAALNARTGARLMRPLQRPLLVKLHGPSLVEEVRLAPKFPAIFEGCQLPVGHTGQYRGAMVG